MVKIGAKRRNGRKEESESEFESDSESESSFDGRKKQRTKTSPIQISKTNPNVQSSTWTPPAENWKKININGSWVARSGESNAGAVVQDADGTILAAGSFSTGSSSSAEVSEAKAANKAIQLAILRGYDNLVFESDSKFFVEQLIRRRQGSTPTDFTELEEEISSFLDSAKAITSWTVTFESRKSNNVAHSLAARRVFMASDTIFLYPFPDWLVNLMKQDVTNYSSGNHTPVTRIYNTRRSKAVLQGHTPASAPAVKNVSATPISRRPCTAISGEFTEGVSQPSSGEDGSFLSSEDITEFTEGSSVSQPSSGEEWSFSSSEDITDFTSEVCKEQSPDEVTKITCAILKDHSPDEVQDEIPLFVPEPAVNNHLPTENAHEGSNNIGTGGDNCGGSPATPLSVSEPAANNHLPRKNHEGSNHIGTGGDNCGGSPASTPLSVSEPAANNHLPRKSPHEGSNNIGTGGDNCGGSPATTPLSVSEPAANNHFPSKNHHEGSNNIGTGGDNCGGSPATTPLSVSEPAANNHLPRKNPHDGSNNIGTGGDNCGGSPATTPLSVSEPAANNHLPRKNPHEGSNNIGTTWDNCGKSPTRSVNMTEIAAMLDVVIYDQDEVGSGPSLVTVHGYRVREEVAFLLRVIIEKYGDIAEKCTLQGKSSRSTQLEVLCGIVQRLKRSCFKEISSSELETIRTEISDLAYLGLDVGWLQQRVEMVSKALSLFWGAATLTKKRRDNREEVELHKKEFEKLEKEIEEMVKRSEAVAEKIEKLKVEGEEIEEMVVKINLTLNGFLGWESLVEGLL